jgi:hypothetical protein
MFSVATRKKPPEEEAICERHGVTTLKTTMRTTNPAILILFYNEPWLTEDHK